MMTNRIDQPREWDLVGDPVLIAGVGTGFEATLSYRVGEGHDEVTGFFTAGGGTGEHGQFHKPASAGRPSSWTGCTSRSSRSAPRTARRSTW
ncbi:Gmad2 immunoglobulin-like domain-containing protein [Streptomyces albus]|uniref:Gmad2 immunoglobulin-like domain-containing protein n=1 Tax=Streptomyces albus TaxID=1888 RepID=UPI000A6DA1D4|nr:Gmad2 immunoglobulin-like domain-containing protein [Streptomyces albus]